MNHLPVSALHINMIITQLDGHEISLPLLTWEPLLYYSYLCFVQPLAYIVKPENRGLVLLKYNKSGRGSAVAGRNLILLSVLKPRNGLKTRVLGIHCQKALLFLPLKNRPINIM